MKTDKQQELEGLLDGMIYTVVGETPYTLWHGTRANKALLTKRPC